MHATVYARCTSNGCGAPTRAQVTGSAPSVTVHGTCPDGHNWVVVVDTQNSTVSAAVGICQASVN